MHGTFRKSSPALPRLCVVSQGSDQIVPPISNSARSIKAVAAVALSIVIAVAGGLVIAAGIIWAFS
jgi:hypothetical protein